MKHTDQIEYDARAKALYLKLASNPATSTTEVAADRVYLDLDDQGRVVGIEVLGVTLPVPTGRFRGWFRKWRAKGGGGEQP